MDEKLKLKIIPLSYIYSCLNALLIIYSQIFVKSNDNNDNNERLFKFRIFLLIVIDSFSIVFNLIYKNYLDMVLYELITTLLFSLQFYEYISFLLDIFSLLLKINENELLNRFVLTFISYLILFPYYKFLYFYKTIVFIIEILTSCLSMICLYCYISYIIRIAIGFKNKNAGKLSIIISSFNLVCLITFLLFNFLKFETIFFDKNEYYQIAYFSSYQGIKYLFYILLIRINSIISKYNINNISKETTINISNNE